MSALVPYVGEVKLLTELLGNGENWTLKLFKNNITPAAADVAGTYTVADFTGYANKTLTRTVTGATWATPTTTSTVTSSQYNSGSPQSWTCSGGSNTIYGYYLVGASSAILILAEAFATARVVANLDVLTLIPQIQLI